MTNEQQRRAETFIARIGRGDICTRERDNGFYVRKRGASRNFGHVRFNERGTNAGRYTIYSYHYLPADDPNRRFSTVSGNLQCRTFVDPDDAEHVADALRALRASHMWS